jgi:SAM-dependent methyltransferase
MLESVSRENRRVFLGQPGYGEVTAGAARAFWRATQLPSHQVVYQYRQGSLLAANFNRLWADALNLAHKGQRVDYFAMLHADVEPQDWWLDTLINELEARNLDVLGAVVPIKDAKGLTSLALARDDGDTWRPHCRLSMSDVFRLPETFTSEDLGRPLLLNTGLWVCRFDLEWARKVRFTINDRIVYDIYKNEYIAEVEPEDWYFSRLCHELGLKVGATRKIRLTHRGPAPFSNERPWGQFFDSSWTDRSPVPEADRDGYVHPWDVLGWLLPEEGKALARLAQGKRVLEIGSYCGLSTICLARTASHVHAIDPHDGRGTPEPRDTLATFQANLLRYDVADKVTISTTPLDFFADGNHWPEDRFDLAFIDGAHDLASVENDIRCAASLLAPGGLLAFHDYDNGTDPDVKVAVDNLLASGGELLSVSGSLAVVRPPASLLAPVPLEV